MHANVLFLNLRDSGDVEDPGLDRRIMNIIEMERELVDWIHLAQDRHKWRVIMNTVVDPRVV
jgi:3-dehydroquinate dehydratase